eukprot:1162351-Amphidinium_carterae.1
MHRHSGTNPPQMALSATTLLRQQPPWLLHPAHQGEEHILWDRCVLSAITAIFCVSGPRPPSFVAVLRQHTWQSDFKVRQQVPCSDTY